MTTFEERLAELAKMQDGWHDGKGRAPTAAAMESARLYLAGLYLYPTYGGGVQIESAADDIEIAISHDGSRSILVTAKIPGPAQLATPVAGEDVK